jgi:L-ectoine synthase
VLVRTLEEVTTVEWGNGLSRRFLLEADGLGYTMTDTIVRAGTASPLHYPHHMEACYCIEGTGWVRDTAGRHHRLEPGTLYALDEHDAHVLGADPDGDMRLVCVFAPALRGDERHQLDRDGHSVYAAPHLTAVPDAKAA